MYVFFVIKIGYTPYKPEIRARKDVPYYSMIQCIKCIEKGPVKCEISIKPIYFISS